MRGMVSLSVAAGLLALGALAQDRAARPAPDAAELRYGPHARNVMDLWLTGGARPAPFVIYYHGGGFRQGDKSSIGAPLLRKLLASGVSVAAANYRLSDSAPYPAQMLDAARALQFLREHAARYGLDPRRAGATGGSAGAGISLWLAFHDDLADPASPDTVARQSTPAVRRGGDCGTVLLRPALHQEAVRYRPGAPGADCVFWDEERRRRG